jgi:hypothetical protein
MRFRLSGPGNAASMIGLCIALIVIGIIFLFVLPWVGIPVGIVGLVLAILWFAGFVRRTARGRQPGDRGDVALESRRRRACALSSPDPDEAVAQAPAGVARCSLLAFALDFELEGWGKSRRVAPRSS